MKIGFVGAGKAGSALGKYFKESGANVSGYYSRTTKSARKAAIFTDSICYARIEQVVFESDIIFLTVPDSEIGHVWDALRESVIDGKMICHCSGVLSSAVFTGIKEKHAYGFSVHPFYAISSDANSYMDISRAFFTIEGDEAYMPVLKHFIEGMGNCVYVIAAEHKVRYHAAAVFLSNQVVALAYLGCQMLEECGFGQEFIQNALRTIFIGNCAKIAEIGPAEALTGPVERNDLPTVKRHMHNLGDDERLIYAVLSRQLIKMMKQKRPELDYSAMDSLLSKYF